MAGPGAGGWEGAEPRGGQEGGPVAGPPASPAAPGGLVPAGRGRAGPCLDPAGRRALLTVPSQASGSRRGGLGVGVSLGDDPNQMGPF